MKSTILFTAVSVMLFSVVQTDAQSVNGEWTLKSCTINGEEVPSGDLGEMSLSLKTTQFKAKSGGRESSGTLKTDLKASPWQATFTIRSGEDSGRELKAIYQKVGNDLQVVFSRNGEFPMSFDSTADNQYAVMTYKTVPRRRVNTAEERRKRRAPSIIASMGGGSGGDAKSENDASDKKN